MENITVFGLNNGIFSIVLYIFFYIPINIELYILI